MPIRSLLVISAITLAVSPALAQDDTKSEGRELSELVFDSIDASHRGYIDLGNMNEFGESVFAGMDYDDSGKVTYEEFSEWDPGFISVAEREGNPAAFTTATKIVYAFWDRNGDGEISHSEFRRALLDDFRRADLDDDIVLTKDEFINGFSMIVALRAAIRPDH